MATGAVRVPTRATTAVRGHALVSALLRVPLAGKLAGANGLVALIVATALALMHDAGPSGGRTLGVTIAALAASLVLNVILVYVALRPVRDLERAAARVSRGELGARVASSSVADADMARVAGTFNALLDQLLADRARVRQLAAMVITAGEAERSRIARELHDSTAQTLAALALQAVTAPRRGDDPELPARLEMIRGMAMHALEEVRALSQTIHSAVLDDLGLRAALERLARRTREQTGVKAIVDADPAAAALPRSVASVLYFVAQEAVRNAVRHGRARTVVIALTAENGTARLEIEDDGHGFDAGDSALRPGAGAGVFAMRERVALMEGTFEIDSAPGRGVRAVARVPLASLRCDALPEERQ